MADSKKVIEGLEAIREFFGFGLPSQSPVFEAYQNILTDAIALLKEQQEQIEQMNFIYGFVYGGRVKEIHKLVRCNECRHRDPEDHKCDCGHDIQWQLPRADDWFCADGQQK